MNTNETMEERFDRDINFWDEMHPLEVRDKWHILKFIKNELALREQEIVGEIQKFDMSMDAPRQCEMLLDHQIGWDGNAYTCAH